MVEIVRHTAEAARGPWWGWEIPVYLFLGGMAAGLMILSSLRVILKPEARRSETFRGLAWLPLVLLSLGMAALWLDLEKRWNVPRFYLAFRGEAPMSWGAWILILVYPAALLHALGELPARLKERLQARDDGLSGAASRLSSMAAEPKRRRTIAWLNIVLGTALGIYTGILLSALGARPLWNSSLLGPLFLVSGLSTAAALMMLFRLESEERHILGRIDAGLIAAELVLLGLFLLGLSSSGEIARRAASLFLGGAYTPAFWGLVITAGLLVPLAAEAWEMRGQPGSRWFAPGLVLVGGLALRWILVSAGQVSAWGMM